MFAIVMAGGVGDPAVAPISTPDAEAAAAADRRDEPPPADRRAARRPAEPHDIYVITGQAHVRATQEQLPQLPRTTSSASRWPGRRRSRPGSPPCSPGASRTRCRSSCRRTTSSPTRRRSSRPCGRRRAPRSAATSSRWAIIPAHAADRVRLHQGRRAAPPAPADRPRRALRREARCPDARPPTSRRAAYFWNAGIFVWRDLRPPAGDRTLPARPRRWPWSGSRRCIARRDG